MSVPEAGFPLWEDILASATVIVIIVPALFPTPAGSFRMTARVAEPTAVTPTAARATIIVPARISAIIVATGISATVVIIVVASLVPSAPCGFRVTTGIAVPTPPAVIVVISGMTIIVVVLAAGIAAPVIIITIFPTLVPSATGSFGMAAGIPEPASVAAAPVIVFITAGTTVVIVPTAAGISAAIISAPTPVVVAYETALIVTFWHIAWHFILQLL